VGAEVDSCPSPRDRGRLRSDGTKPQGGLLSAAYAPRWASHAQVQSREGAVGGAVWLERSGVPGGKNIQSLPTNHKVNQCTRSWAIRDTLHTPITLAIGFRSVLFEPGTHT